MQHDPSVRTTQTPTPAGTRASSPQNGMPAPGVMTSAPPPAQSSIIPVVHKPTLQDCKDGAAHLFILKITATKTIMANYDPARAESFLNSALQDALAEVTGIKDIPQNLYRVDFQRPTPGTLEYGLFRCRIPGPLADYVPDLTAPKNDQGRLVFTGDDRGNQYKLTLEAHVQKEFLAEKKHEPNEKFWLHVIPDGGLQLGKRALYDITAGHLAKFGMTIQEHDHAFFETLTKDKEQGSGKWHCEYDLNEPKVPTVPDTNGLWDISALQTMTINPDTNERAKIWIKKELLSSVFGACDHCWKHKRICQGHDPKPQQGQKRESAAEADAAAKRRMGKKAKQTFGF